MVNINSPADPTKEKLIRDLTALRLRITELEQSEQDRREYHEELVRIRAMFVGLFEFAPDAILVVGHDGKIERANKQAEKLFGYSRDELLHLDHDILLPEGFRENHLAHRRTYMAEPHILPMGTGWNFTARKRTVMNSRLTLPSGPFRLKTA